MVTQALPFVGRRDAIDIFHSLRSIRAQKNALYLEADGGLGKTRLLRELIRQSPLPGGSVGPTPNDIDPLIDFFEFQNRSVSGLRHSIIARLGEGYFEEFRASEAELTAVEGKLGLLDRHLSETSEVSALRRRVDTIFFRDFARALRGRHIVLFFDTFELAYHRRVGRWFLDQFLPRSEGSLVVFAGRPVGLQNELLPNVLFYTLQPWSVEEVRQYFTARGWEIDEDNVVALRAVTGGSPLLIDMVQYLRNAGKLSLEQLRAMAKDREALLAGQAQIESALIDRLVRVGRPEHYAILEMAYLKRRFDPGIFAARQTPDERAYPGIPTFDSLVTLLLDNPDPGQAGLRSIVKYRTRDRVLTLHDEAQRMLEQHAPTLDKELWEDTCAELYDGIVQGWYPTTFNGAEAQVEQELLRAEHFGYELEHAQGNTGEPTEQRLNDALTLYDAQFEEIQQNRRFDFNELIWGEMADKINSGAFVGHEYPLSYHQADWLWFVGQFDAAAYLYREIITKYTPDRRHGVRRLEALASYGHAMMELGRYEEARLAFDEGIALAQSIGNRRWLSAHLQNMGQLYQNISEWTKAEDYFQQAVETAETTRSKEALALVCVNLGRLLALLGHYDQAIMNCERAVALRRHVLAQPDMERQAAEEENDPYYEPLMEQPGGYLSDVGRQARLGVAYLRLAEAYRYSGAANRPRARRNYEKAIDLLRATSQYRHWTEAEQGLANVFYDEGYQAAQTSNFSQAVGLYAEAYRKLDEAIGMCRTYGLRQQLPKALHRMAHVFFQLGKLEAGGSLRHDLTLRSLSRQAVSFLLPEEEVWLREAGSLRETEPFASLDTIAKAQRLFEISSLEADRLEDVNTELDSLVEAAEIALYRQQYDQVRAFARLTRVPSNAYHQELFVALIDLVQADLDLNEGHLEKAITQYANTLPVIASLSGYGRYLLKDYLARLGQRLAEMPAEQAIQFCEHLINRWTSRGLDRTHPELIAQMWEYHNDIQETYSDQA